MLRPGESRGSPMRLNVMQLADKMFASRGQRTRPSPFRVPRAFLSISLLVVRVGWYVWWVQMGCSSVPAWPSHPPGTALGHGTPNAIRRLEFL